MWKIRPIFRGGFPKPLSKRELRSRNLRSVHAKVNPKRHIFKHLLRSKGKWKKEVRNTRTNPGVFCFPVLWGDVGKREKISRGPRLDLETEGIPRSEGHGHFNLKKGNHVGPPECRGEYI